VLKVEGERLAEAVYAVQSIMRWLTNSGMPMNCPCSDCRKATGSAFKPFGGIEREKLKITKGEEHASVFGDRSANHDVHCAACGSLLYSVVRDGAFVHVTMGTLIDETDSPPYRAHLCCGQSSVVRDQGRPTSV
jgi:hypothetical protein